MILNNSYLHVFLFGVFLLYAQPQIDLDDPYSTITQKKNEISRCYEFDADSIEKMNVIIHAYDIVFMRMKWATSHYAHVTLLSEAHTNGDELQRASLTNLKLYLDSVW